VFLGPVVVAVCYEMVLKWIEPDTLPPLTLKTKSWEMHR
jgi:hypothetical protein